MTKIKIFGHRCFRGKHPENTTKSLQEACQHHISGVEIDLIVNKEGRLVVSHEPWMNHLFCLDPQGQPIPEKDQKSHNLFQMDFETIKTYDCGSKVNPNFSEQIPYKSYKPLFQEFINTLSYPSGFLIIEIKSNPTWVNLYQPDHNTYANIIQKELEKSGIEPRNCILQSFDSKILNHLHALLPHYSYGLLVEGSVNLEKDLDQLSFKPQYYNPDYTLIDKGLIQTLQEKEIDCICWTVNSLNQAVNLKNMGVQGIITDYPNLINETSIKKGL